MKKPLSPQKVLTEFLRCWKSQRWNRMPGYCQKTWISNTPSPSTFLMNVFGNLELVKWEIIKTEKVGEACVDITVQVDFMVGDLKRITKEKVRLICEREPFRADTNGDWGVNPISVFKLFRNTNAS